MKRWVITLILIFILAGTGYAGTTPVFGLEFGLIMTDCSSVIEEGSACWDSDDDKLYSGNGTAAVLVGNTGDVIGVGDCASGACLDGTSDGGTYIKFYDAQGAGQLIIGNLTGAQVWTLPDSTGTVALTNGNVATASALFADPTDCGAGACATAIAANGNLTCGITPVTTELDPVVKAINGEVCSNGSTIAACTAENIPLPPVTSGDGVILTTNNGYHIVTGTTTFTLPATAAGKQHCFRQADAGTNAILITPPASSYVEASDGSAYCTVSHAIKSSGAVGDSICYVAIDTTHWVVFGGAQGTWTCQ